MWKVSEKGWRRENDILNILLLNHLNELYNVAAIYTHLVTWLVDQSKCITDYNHT